MSNRKNSHKIRIFFDLGTYCWQFIFGFVIAKPLAKLTEKKQAFHWIPEVNPPSELYTVQPLFLLTRGQEKGASLTQARIA
jgi:hypothetical protein